MSCTFIYTTVQSMYMAFLRAERGFLRAVSELAYCNPFLPEHTDLERAALGREFMEGEPVWSFRSTIRSGRAPTSGELFAKSCRWPDELRARLRSRRPRQRTDLVLYEDAVLNLLYQRYYRAFTKPVSEPAQSASALALLSRIPRGLAHFSRRIGVFRRRYEPAHTFACFRQIQRAFEQIFRDIIGGSLPAARLRAAVWQSIFTHDMRRYRRTLYSAWANSPR